MLAVWIASLSVLMVIVIGVAYLVISSGDEDKKCTGGKVLKDKKCVCPDEFSWDEALSKCVAADAAATAATACTGGKVMVDDVCTCVSPLVWNEPLSKCAEDGLIYEKKDEFKSDYSLLHGPFEKPSNMRISFDVKKHVVSGHNSFLIFTDVASDPTFDNIGIPMIYFDNNLRLAVKNKTPTTNYTHRDESYVVPNDAWTSVVIDINGSRIKTKINDRVETQRVGSDTTLDTSMADCYLYNGIFKMPGGTDTVADVTLKNLKITKISAV